MSTTTTYTLQEVSQHATQNDCWIVVHGKVYDVTKFLAEHPGGLKVLLAEAGKDATEKFDLFHSRSVLDQFGAELCIGTVGDSHDGNADDDDNEVGPVNAPYGDLVPFGDPNWYQTFNSPYYKETHVKWRKRVRAFVDEHIMPYVDEWDRSPEHRLPRSLFKAASAAGILQPSCGTWPTDYTDVEGPKDWDAFHALVLIDELSRCASGGVIWGLAGGISIGLPPIWRFGSDYLKQKVVRECLSGDKIICLAITEPTTGSDVANIRTTARREGDYYIVNGNKKFITNGIFADYFTVAVRTGGAGMRGVSLLLIERTMPGVKTRHISCMGVHASGTAYITFDDVRVPVKNLIGKENKGFRLIMANFNHERFGLAVQSNRFARVCVEDAFRYATKRRTFGKPLIEHQVIRYKLAEMQRRVEATHMWIENMAYQLETMDEREAMIKLAAAIALLKIQATRTFEYCANEAAQVFGGNSYMRGSGPGARVERLFRETKVYTIGGGSAEILADLAVRTELKIAQQVAKL